MPELPEVQTVVNDLNALHILGSDIARVRAYWRRTVDNVSDLDLRYYLAGMTVETISRRGKYIRFGLSSGKVLIIHLRMSGRLRYVPSKTPVEKHEQATVKLNNGHDLRFYDPRKFGRIYIGPRAEEKLAKLGPEPLARKFTSDKFERLLNEHRRQIKPFLLDQAMLAGLGNIYADEALWRAGVHPLSVSNSLPKEDRKALYRSIRAVLNKGIRNFGTSLGEGESNFISVSKRKGQNGLKLKVYGQAGEQCPRCKRRIERIKVAQRSSHICPHCQTVKTASQRMHGQDTHSR